MIAAGETGSRGGATSGLAAGGDGWSWAWSTEWDLVRAIRLPRTLGALLAGALLGAPLGEGWSMALSGLGLAASLLALAWHARRAAGLDAHRPVITRLLSQPSSTARNVSSCQHARSPGDWSA